MAAWSAYGADLVMGGEEPLRLAWGLPPLIMKLREAIDSLAVQLLVLNLHQRMKTLLLLEMLQRKFRYVVKA